MEQLDRAVGNELADDDEPSDQRAVADEHPVVRAAEYRFGEGVEPRGERVHDRHEVDGQEVVGRGLTVRAPFRSEHSVEFFEYRVGNADGSPFAAHRPSVGVLGLA